ncbi:class I SAM-dependent methyltransferase [Methylobacterium sp. C25]|uniref:class I SAM-dependent methyltransferase n=1 Tax=Methylobacterium sp. C25 TaxID=2721622 RepID=UPI001F4154A7|nr:class I SAM-dependent methyltransferase [Methylobacterium sp. C25]MCE4225400.1 class I SAM-dependent methyltransferase [Methylobacterium sp. C25]
MKLLSKILGRQATAAPFLRAGAAVEAPGTWNDVVRSYERPVDQANEQACAQNAAEAAYYAQVDRVANKWHHYLEIYDRHLSNHRDKPVRFLELGVCQGGSLQVWRRYLGDSALLHGLDIDPRCATIDDTDLVIHIGSQTDTGLLGRVVEQMGGIDVVIDDASHISAHQITSFEFLYPLLAPDGVYIVEDAHSSYWQDFGGGLRAPGSFMEYAKRLIDRLHAGYVLNADPVSRDPGFAAVTHGISFYDSMVVFEKRSGKARPRSTIVGTRWLA